MINERIAIVGMQALFSIDEGLDAFDLTVFDSLQRPLPSVPDQGKKIVWGRKPQSKEGFLPRLDPTNPSTATSLLNLVLRGALQDTPSKATTDIRSDTAIIFISSGELPSLDFNPKLILREHSLAQALKSAQDLLSHREVRSVVLSAVHLGQPEEKAAEVDAKAEGDSAPNTSGLSAGEGAGAVLLKRLDQAREDQDRVYAILEALVVDTDTLSSEASPSSESVAEACTKALKIAGLNTGDIGYIEMLGKSMEEEDPIEVAGLAQAYQQEPVELTCALGSAQTNLGPGPLSSQIAGLIRTVLCLYHRYFPGTPEWTGPKNMALWEKSPFYVATESRPWFLDPSQSKLVAAISSLQPGEAAHLILSEDVDQQDRPNRYLALVAPYCFPLAEGDQTSLASRIEALQRAIETTDLLPDLARETFTHFQTQPDAPYALMLVGYKKEELLEEIRFLLDGLPAAFENGLELKTPRGSYFTANPLGSNGQLAFVYPGVGSAYVGLGQATFHMFPDFYPRMSELTPNMGELLKERKLYPRSRTRLTADETWKIELWMRRDIMTIAESGMGFFGLCTTLLRERFQVHPQCALGYSMGEPAMLASLGVWADPFALTDRFRQCPTFNDRLQGELNAVREYWGLDGHTTDLPDKLWDSYTLRATPDAVREAMAGIDRVFLTIINTPEEVVIAGDPKGCLRVAEQLDCKYYPLGLELAIHCGPTQLEYDRMAKLYTLPVNRNTDVKFYSSSCYQPIPIRSNAVAHSIAEAFCQPVDFPRLVNQAYDDGVRFFVEIGSRKFCCNLIEKILKDRDHVALPVNVKGTKDQTTFARLLAQLVSHRVPVDLSPLF
jgi:PfaB family protein